MERNSQSQIHKTKQDQCNRLHENKQKFKKKDIYINKLLI